MDSSKDGASKAEIRSAYLTESLRSVRTRCSRTEEQLKEAYQERMKHNMNTYQRIIAQTGESQRVYFTAWLNRAMERLDLLYERNTRWWTAWCAAQERRATMLARLAPTSMPTVTADKMVERIDTSTASAMSRVKNLPVNPDCARVPTSRPFAVDAAIQPVTIKQPTLPYETSYPLTLEFSSDNTGECVAY